MSEEYRGPRIGDTVTIEVTGERLRMLLGAKIKRADEAIERETADLGRARAAEAEVEAHEAKLKAVYGDQAAMAADMAMPGMGRPMGPFVRPIVHHVESVSERQERIIRRFQVESAIYFLSGYCEGVHSHPGTEIPIEQADTYHGDPPHVAVLLKLKKPLS